MDLTTLIAQRNALDEDIKKVGKEEFGALIAGIFELEPELTNFGWWNAPEDAFNDGAVPGIEALTVNVEVDEDSHYVDTYGGYRYSDALGMRVRKYITQAGFTNDLLCEIFGHTGRWGSQTIVVFSDRIEFFEPMDY